ncbi:hypothetical protein E2C01_085284 [Portunus trituberculatus]|uniref:Uncharacterized protein n=1 Tax=Portunus trituberculatus TaxID=210409 RepID=A0A5B7JA23_PORTR|nr:hypothetical protein [Portunus trituberculatus]
MSPGQRGSHIPDNSRIFQTHGILLQRNITYEADHEKRTCVIPLCFTCAPLPVPPHLPSLTCVPYLCPLTCASHCDCQG